MNDSLIHRQDWLKHVEQHNLELRINIGIYLALPDAIIQLQMSLCKVI